MQSSTTRLSLRSWCCLRTCKQLFRSINGTGTTRLFESTERVTGILPTRLYASTAVPQQQHIAIVGSGPAGFYTAQQILKGNTNLCVDIFEKLPVPFGLVRFGVAPDHPEVKNVINTFTQTAQNERLNYFGNVEVGKDVSLQELRKSYSAVVLCYGAAHDRVLGIPGEDFKNCLSARSFVGWYNGLPEDSQLEVNLDCESAVILGHGNVALDAARMLLTPINILEKTDITEHALVKLRESRIKKVYLVGRRGPLQVAFTIKELREMVRLPGVRTLISRHDVHGLDKLIKELSRPRRRLTELLFKSGMTPSAEDVARWKDADREWELLFCRTPMAILGTEGGRVKGVEFALNQLKGDSLELKKAEMTDLKETINCGLVLRSIGYKGHSIDPSIPFDATSGTIRNEVSRVEGEKGLYCAGWVGRGPVGVILNTMTDGFETGKVVVHDLNSGSVPQPNAALRNSLVDRLKSSAVSFQEWEKIDAAETTQGEKIGKPREKFVNPSLMVEVAKALH